MQSFAWSVVFVFLGPVPAQPFRWEGCMALCYQGLSACSVGFSLPSQAVYYSHNSFLLCDLKKNYFLIFLRLHRHFITLHSLLVLPFIFSLWHLEPLFAVFVPQPCQDAMSSLLVLWLFWLLFLMCLWWRHCSHRCSHHVAAGAVSTASTLLLHRGSSLSDQHNDLEATALAKILMHFCFSRIFMDL